MSIRQALRLFARRTAQATARGTVRLSCAALLAAGGAQAAHAADVPAPLDISLPEALAAARSNLDVRIATRGLAAAQADILAADHAPLPQLSGKLSQIDLQHGIGPGNVLRDKRIDKAVGLDWTWERGDKRALRTEAARRIATAASADVDEVRNQQALAAHVAFFDLLASQERQDHLAEIARSGAQTAAIAKKRLDAGDVAVQDAARAAVEAERAQADADAARQDVDRARRALAQITAREADAARLRARGDWPVAASAGDDPPLHTLVALRADVAAAQERVRAAEAALSGARAQRQGDVTWGVSMDHYPGTSTRQLELRASMPLSWGYAYEGESARAQAQLEQAQDQLDKTRRAAEAELQRLQSELAAAARRAARFEAAILPRSREVAARAETAYGKGALPLTDLLDARRTLRAVLLDDLAARADLAKAQGAWQLRSSVAR